jgi:mxaL protein
MGLRRFRDPAGRCLLAALLLAGLACLPLRQTRMEPVFTYIAVVDITRSMNVEDYQAEGKAVSRLEFARRALRRLAADLPCGSRLGLGVFTERSSALLFEPVETCEGYPAIAAALDKLDWRMAWAADSRIAAGLFSTLDTLSRYADARLLFITDGQEAPPINPRYRTNFDPVRGRMKGVLVGAGGLTPKPIPKFDEQGRRLGFVEPDEVPHRSTFGLSELPPEEIEGYHARNAPFGNAPAAATEHLSALREDYLRRLAGETGLDYHRLESDEGLHHALVRPEFAGRREVVVDARGLPAAFALAALAVAYLFSRLHGFRGNAGPDSRSGQS